MGSRIECWGKYAAHLKTWYVNTYKGNLGSTRAINDGRLIKKVALKKQDNLTYQDLKNGGVSEFGARTILLYVSNTKKSYMGRCITNTGGFAVDVECMGDSDCPPGYRCRGRGKDSLCVEEAAPYEPPTLLPSMPDFPSLDGGFGGVKQSLQVTGVVVMVFILAIVYLMFTKGGAGREVQVG